MRTNKAITRLIQPTQKAARLISNVIREKIMKFELSHDKRNISDDDLIENLRKVVADLKITNLTQTVYKENGKYGLTTIIRRFGSWAKAMEKAGIKKSRASKITKEELFENLEKVWIKLGRQPSYTEVQKPLSKFHVASYDRKFGSWRRALEEFVEFVNSVDETERILTRKEEKLGHKTSRTINLRLRFRIMQRDNFKCKICGRSPATELGVLLEVDHIIPWSERGETINNNLQTLCSLCNQGKSNLTM